MDTLDRLISIIIYADIVGYSSMMQADEELALSKLKHFEEVLNIQSKKYDGEIVKAYGDGCLMLFPSAVSAIKCAISIQSDLREAPYVPLRIGIHIGEIVRKDHDIFGDGLNIASRIESMGVANSVLISSDIYYQIKNHPEIKTVKLGDFAFKNIERDITLYAISNDGLTVPLSTDMKGKGDLKESASRSSNRMRRLMWIPIILILAVVGLYQFSIFPLSTEEKEYSMAVLSLKNLNQENENLEYFSDGMTYEITTELAKIKKFVAVASTSTIIYKNSELRHIEIANELGVTYLIAGSFSVFGDSIRLNIEFFNAHTNEIVWNEAYTEVLDHAPKLQISIAKQVAKSLDIELSAAEEKSLEKVKTVDGEAFKLFLKAKSEVIKLTEEGFNNSVTLLERVLELDPDYSQAHTLLAWSHVLLRSSWVSGDQHDVSTFETESFALPHIEKAIELDPKSSDVYLVRANMNLLQKGLLKDAKRDVDYALKLNSWPRIPTDYCICSVVTTYVANGEYERAKELASIARKVDPENVFIYFDQATIHMVNDEKAEAQAILTEALEKIDVPFFTFFLGWSYYHDDKYDIALKYFEKAYNVDEKPIPFSIAYLSNAHLKLGNMDESERYRLELEQRIDSGQHHMSLTRAMVAASRNNIDETLTWLEKAQEDRDFGVAYFMNVDPIFKPFMDEPRFVEMRRKMQYYDKESSY